jgi:hypothetical protein
MCLCVFVHPHAHGRARGPRPSPDGVGGDSTSSLERFALGEFKRPLAAAEAAALGRLLAGEPPGVLVLRGAFPLFLHSLPSGVVEYVFFHPAR